MTEDQLNDAASALWGVYDRAEKGYGDSVPSAFWDAFPERCNVSRKRVAQIAEQVRQMFAPVLTGGTASEFWSWVSVRMSYAAQRYERERDEAAETFAAAQRRAFILPLENGEYHHGLGGFQSGDPGRALEDAERRLDRQVSRAIADLEAVRRLRP